MASPSPSQIAHYAADGFLICEGLLSRDDVDVLCRRMSEIAEGNVASFPTGAIEFEPDTDDNRSAATVRKINQCAELDDVLHGARCESKNSGRRGVVDRAGYQTVRQPVFHEAARRDPEAVASGLSVFHHRTHGACDVLDGARRRNDREWLSRISSGQPSRTDTRS